ncbi:MAG: hypothetical protein EBZ47_00650 [Chlamydiae bacterium]|nr:hypothetical protein [Chlamydiota bacterium]
MQYPSKTLLFTSMFSGLTLTHLYADYSYIDTQTNTTTPVVTTSISDAPKPQPLPSARPEVNEGFDLFIMGELLIWKTNTSGLVYAIQDNSKNATTIANGYAKSPNFNYNYGFDVDIGCNLSHDGWDAILGWTWFRDTSNNQLTNNNNSATLFTTFISPTAISKTNIDGPCYAQTANSNLHIKLDLVDLEMGREFYAGKWLSLRPFFGMRSGWITQNLTNNYQNVTDYSNPSSIVFSDYQAQLSNYYFGFGPRLGINSYWGFGSGWSLYGNISLAILFGYFKIQHNEYSYSTSGAETVQKSIHNSYHATKPVTDAELGIQWDCMILNDAIHLGFNAGWQQVLFFSQNQFMHFTSPSEQGQFFQNQGDLAFQGFTFGMRIDF